MIFALAQYRAIILSKSSLRKRFLVLLSVSLLSASVARADDFNSRASSDQNQVQIAAVSKAQDGHAAPVLRKYVNSDADFRIHILSHIERTLKLGEALRKGFPELFSR